MLAAAGVLRMPAAATPMLLSTAVFRNCLRLVSLPSEDLMHLLRKLQDFALPRPAWLLKQEELAGGKPPLYCDSRLARVPSSARFSMSRAAPTNRSE